MSVFFETSDPSGLLAAFKKAIRDGHIDTWGVDSDGDFTHTPDQWNKKAWLRPQVFSSGLMMRFIGREKVPATREDFAVFQGRFIESMTVHCYHLFRMARASASPTNDDITKQVA